MGENLVGLFCVPHVFLNSKVVHAQIKVQRGRHADGTQIRCPVRASSYLIHFGEVCNLSQMCNTASMHDRGTNVVDELLLNQLLAIEDRIENLAYRKRCRSVTADQTKTLLHLRRSGVFEPKKVQRFK